MLCVSAGIKRKMTAIVCILVFLTCMTVPGPGIYAEAGAGSGDYLIGAGIYDITGPAAEVGMMGYAQVDQTTAGIHQRLRSRAFVIAEPSGGKRVVFVNADLGVLSQSIKLKVVEKLRQTYGDTYTEKNVLLTATHTHSGPAGYSYYALYNITIKGFIEQNFNCIVDGIYQSIVRAHNNLEPGTIKINSGRLDGTSVNRSEAAYMMNPQDERDKYTDDVDKTMTLLKLESSSGQQIGIINWFAVHGTSMNNKNKLISGDNKGYASYLYEKAMNTDYLNPKTFVAAFAQNNSGDSSPNIYGGGTSGYGGDNDFESTRYAGSIQYEKALELSSSAASCITGSIDYRHEYIDFSNIIVRPEYADGIERRTYPAAMGYSFATGAEDGPSGVEMFHEGMTTKDYPYGSVNAVSAFQASMMIIPYLNTVDGANYPELWPLHDPKPILFATSQGKPYPWTPDVLPVQILKIGQLRILAVPFETTTMSGRRLIDAVKAATGDDNGIYVLSGLSNAYADYLATPEEYMVQNYEGASTLFGKWELCGLKQELCKLAEALKNGTPVADGPAPRDLSNEQHNAQTGVVLDNVPIGKAFGQVVTDVNTQVPYAKGSTVDVKFWTGHPKNDLKLQSTYLEVQRYDNGNWATVARDWDWDTKYTWIRIDPVWGSSQADIQWDIPQDAQSGSYRIVHYGSYLNGWTRKVVPFTGVSSTFTVR